MTQLIASIIACAYCMVGFAVSAADLPPRSVVRSSAAVAVSDVPIPPSQTRRPASDADLKYWLENMVWHHRLDSHEIVAATGLSASEVAAALVRYSISPTNRPVRPPGAPLLVLPYPGGRHPRIGFLEGAIQPQRETKVSVFTPWDEKSYVVIDVPEAIWSNLGLTYLAHTHVPTIWTKARIELPPLEWDRKQDGTFETQRILPNGIGFGTRIKPARDAIHMELWLTNGTPDMLSQLRIQNCVMLKAAVGFNQQTNGNKVFTNPYVACSSPDKQRWVITAWEHCQRPWGNPPVPCLHSDPQFPDCPPGETKRLRGWLSFYEGSDITNELARIERTGWRAN